MEQRQYGLLGRKLGHSYSKKIHEDFGKYEYQLFQVEPEDLTEFLNNEALEGLNVTIPYKKDVIAFCESLSKEAKEIGAVNTMKRMQDGGWAGYNTDYSGFLYLLKQADISLKDKKVAILGSGGTSLTVTYAAKKQGAKEIVCISRTGESNYGNLYLHKDAQIVVNTTPVGMYPQTEESAVSLTEFPLCEGVIDVIYNPLRTRLVLQAEAKGIPAVGGLGMLAEQAVQAAALFTGEEPQHNTAKGVLKKLQQSTENIVLVGMPGSGKTSVGRQLARELSRPFIDIDQVIFEEEGSTAEELINTKGEPYFRECERKAIQKIAAQTRLVVATGGGAVLAEGNRIALKQNGRLYYINRKTESLATQGRPLSVNTEKLYIERHPIYTQTADAIIDNNKSMQIAVQAILKEFTT